MDGREPTYNEKNQNYETFGKLNPSKNADLDNKDFQDGGLEERLLPPANDDGVEKCVMMSC